MLLWLLQESVLCIVARTTNNVKWLLLLGLVDVASVKLVIGLGLIGGKDLEVDFRAGRRL